jgi:hypothetical protein
MDHGLSEMLSHTKGPRPFAGFVDDPRSFEAQLEREDWTNLISIPALEEGI